MATDDITAVRGETHVSAGFGDGGIRRTTGAVDTVQELGGVFGEGVDYIVGMTSGSEKHMLSVVAEFELAPGGHARRIREAAQEAIVRHRECGERLLVVVAEVVKHYAL